MSDNSSTVQVRNKAALLATAEQLDIASEDVSEALTEILNIFETTSAQLESIEAQLAAGTAPEVGDPELLANLKAARERLRAAVVSLQFEDRLSQRLSLAARELRQHFGDPDLQLQLEDRPEPVLTSTVHSLYARNQVQRILGAAGFRAEDEHDADDSASGDSVELF